MDLPELREVVPKESLRFRYVTEQSLDGSCGYAAAATLLGIYWNLAVAEQGLIGSWSELDENSKKFQVSLADISRMIESYGLKTRGLKLGWDDLMTILDQHAPIIVHYDRPDKHFAVLLGQKNDRLVLADSSRGLELLTKAEFLAHWSGFILVSASDKIAKNQERLTQAIESAHSRARLIDHLAKVRL